MLNSELSLLLPFRNVCDGAGAVKLVFAVEEVLE